MLWTCNSLLGRLFDEPDPYVPSSSGNCPLGFNRSSSGLPRSGQVASDEDEDDANVERVVEEEEWW